MLNRELIRKSPIFRSLDNRSIVLVLRRLTTLTLPPETVALRQGQPNSAMYFVSRGLLIVLEDEQVVGTLTDQDCFGEDSMVRRAAAARPPCDRVAMFRHDDISPLPSPWRRCDRSSG